MQCLVCLTINQETASTCTNCGAGLQPARAQLYLDRAEAEINAGQFDSASNLLARADHEMIPISPQQRNNYHLTARALYLQGWMNYSSGKTNQARADLLLAERSLKQNADNRLLAQVLNKLGNICYLQGHLDEAGEYYQRSSEAALQVEAFSLVVSAVNNLGNISIMRGDIAAATAYYERSRNYADLAGNRAALASSYRMLSWLHSNYGPFPVALDYANRSWSLRSEIPNTEERCTIINNIGAVYTRWGDYSRAEYYLNEAANLATASGSTLAQERVNDNFAELKRQQGDDNGWLLYANRGFNSPDVSIINKMTFALHLALYYSYHQDHTHAQSHLEWLRQRMAKEQLENGVAVGELGVAFLQLTLGDSDSAEQHFQAALAAKSFTFYEQAIAWEDYARLLMKAARIQSKLSIPALAALKQAAKLYREMNIPRRLATIQNLLGDNLLSMEGGQ